MPRYEFLCSTCKKPFELTMTISEREKAKPKCPTCQVRRVGTAAQRRFRVAVFERSAGQSA